MNGEEASTSSKRQRSPTATETGPEGSAEACWTQSQQNRSNPIHPMLDPPVVAAAAGAGSGPTATTPSEDTNSATNDDSNPIMVSSKKQKTTTSTSSETSPTTTSTTATSNSPQKQHQHHPPHPPPIKSSSLLPQHHIQVPWGPVFYPTIQDMEGSPLKYLETIKPIAERYGIAKIVPPPGWSTNFFGTLDTCRFVVVNRRMIEFLFF